MTSTHGHIGNSSSETMSYDRKAPLANRHGYSTPEQTASQNFQLSQKPNQVLFNGMPSSTVLRAPGSSFVEVRLNQAHLSSLSRHRFVIGKTSYRSFNRNKTNVKRTRKHRIILYDNSHSALANKLLLINFTSRQAAWDKTYSTSSQPLSARSYKTVNFRNCLLSHVW